MEHKVQLKRNVYIILAGILLLAVAIQLTSSKYVLQSSRNEALPGQKQIWKPAAADAAALKPTGVPYCILYDSSNDESVLVQKQTARTLAYMKKPVESFDVNKNRYTPSACSTVVIATERLDLIGDMDELSQYVEQGGYVFVAIRPDVSDAFYRIYRKMGIIGAELLDQTTGIKLVSNVLIREKGLTTTDSFVGNSSLLVELDDNSRVHAVSNEGVPLLWDYTYGKGKFMVLNGTMLIEKYNRGFFAGAISMLEPDFIYPVFNSKLFYIDDFPAPLPPGIDKQIYAQYHRTIPNFYKEIWWPDMLRAAKRFDVKFTAVLIESYHDNVQPPFRAPIDADLRGLIAFGREVLKNGGEIGLHGYNHQSFTLSKKVADEFDYVPWVSTEDMAESVEEAIRFAAEAFPNYSMVSYVPPSNVMDPEGREALKKGWPNLAVISSLYGEDASGVAYVQEFEIANDGILEMPRLTSGYYERPFDRWMMANAITTHGFFSHFIHPDDLLDAERGQSLDWEHLYSQFSAMLKRLDDTYPWLRQMTGAEAAVDMEKMLNSRVDFTQDEHVIHGKIESFQSKQYFILRTSRKMTELSGCETKKIDDGVYLITAHKADFEIKLGD
ncbi:DUF2194 domain-containing protein [Paenibacillus sp. GCM10027626]|uniref:DUF2194 domain-containing protein n=1 Tax=Paenibacillus sp. GCM10027626 TaxID=3273411 RepID=UPI00363F30DB